MCNPIAFAAASAAVSIMQNVGANKATAATARAMTQQNQLRADEIAKQAGKQLSERARAARREKGAARAASSSAGVNLDSNSFLAMLNTADVNQTYDNGVILYNEQEAQKARQAQYASAMSQLTIKTPLGIATDAAASGLQGYFAAGGKTYLGKQPGKG